MFLSVSINPAKNWKFSTSGLGRAAAFTKSTFDVSGEVTDATTPESLRGNAPPGHTARYTRYLVGVNVLTGFGSSAASHCSPAADAVAKGCAEDHKPY